MIKFSGILDNVIMAFSPRWGTQRIAIRQYAARIRAGSGAHRAMEKMLGGSQGGYEAGRTDRLRGRIVGSPHENDVPRQQIAALRWRAWNLHRNSGQARKICRNLGAKVVGRDVAPQPQALTVDGKPFVAYRNRAREIWGAFIGECDWRGKPGFGGHNLPSNAKTALRNCILSGGALYRFHPLSRQEQQRLGLYVPLQIELIHVDRLDDQKCGDNQFYGIQFGADGRVSGYWILPPCGRYGASQDSEFVPVALCRHLFVEEDIDQHLGSPWVGAAMNTMDDRRNYEFAEMTAAEMGACLVAGFRRSSGQSGFGLAPPGGPAAAETELTDGDGNKVTHLQPGMLLDLGATGELQTINPGRPNSGAEGFLQHLVRTEAVSVPGVKASTLTGDYRNSSFSSERSADNDVWPEIEDLQDWFAKGFLQPIFEECITQAVIAGMFDDVPGFELADFVARKRSYLSTAWQGPVARSINPRDDAEAARARVKNATSTPQRENAQVGRDWREVLQETKEFIDYCQELELPDDIWQQALGIEQQDANAALAAPDPAAADATPPTEQQQDDAFEAAKARTRAASFHLLNSAG